MFNNIVETSFDTRDYDAQFENAIAELKELPANSTWLIGGELRKSNLDQRLHSLGYRTAIPADAIAISLSDANLEPDPDWIHVVEVSDESMLREWVEIEAEVFGFPAQLEALWFEMQRDSGFGPDGRWHHFIGSVDDTPSCTISSFHGVEAVSYANLAVRPSDRGRNAGTAMMRSCMRHSRDAGYGVGVGIANRSSIGLCTRMGFRSVGPFSFVSVGPNSDQDLHLRGESSRREERG